MLLPKRNVVLVSGELKLFLCFLQALECTSLASSNELLQASVWSHAVRQKGSIELNRQLEALIMKSKKGMSASSCLLHHDPYRASLPPAMSRLQTVSLYDISARLFGYWSYTVSNMNSAKRLAMISLYRAHCCTLYCHIVYVISYISHSGEPSGVCSLWAPTQILWYTFCIDTHDIWHTVYDGVFTRPWNCSKVLRWSRF